MNSDLKHFFAGGIASATARTCIAPIERTRLLYQLDGNFSKLFVPRNNLGHIHFAFQNIRSTFKGNAIAIVKLVPSASLYFYGFGFSKRFLKENTDLDDIPRHITASLIGSVISTIPTYPLDTIYTRISSGNFTLKSAIAEGKLYNGSIMTLGYYLPYSALCITLFEELKKHPIVDNLTVNNFIAGAVAGTLAHILVYPIETIKRRIQSDSTLNIRTVLRSPIISLWAGFSLIFLKTPLNSGLVMMIYEKIVNS